MPKKILISLLLVFIFVFGLSMVVSAEDDIKMIVNGTTITENLDYQIVNQNIMVPLHLLTDNLDIKQRWFSSIKTLQLEMKDKTVKMRIGDKNLQVNDKLIKMPVVAQKKDEQFIIPLKSLGDALGLVIKSRPKDKVVEVFEVKAYLAQIKHQKTEDYEGIEVISSKKVDYQLDMLHKPRRLVFDLSGAILKKIQKVDVESELMKGVRVAQFNSNTVRVVLDLFANLDCSLDQKKIKDGYKYLIKLSPIINNLDYDNQRVEIKATRPLENTSISYLSNPKRAVIDIKNAAIKEKEELKIGNEFIKQLRVSQYQTKPHNVVRAVLDLKKEAKIKVSREENSLFIKMIKAQLEDISYKQGEKRKVSFKLSNKVKPRVFSLEKGDRLVFDFPDVINNFKAKRIKVDNALIEEIRVSQFDEYTTRVVVDLVELVPYRFGWNANNFELRLMNRLVGLDIKDEGLKTKVDLALLAPSSYEVEKLLNPHRLVININNAIVNQANTEISKESGMIKDIRISQYSNNPEQVRAVLELKDNFDFNLTSKEESKNVRLELTKFNLKDKVIVLDAGHGGSDPGALGDSKLREKNVVLDIALKLEKLLEDAGAEVVMTRKGDHSVGLRDRTKLANSQNPDIFVSIHVNAHQIAQPMGTETYIDQGSSEKEELLGRFIQQSLVEKLGTFDRGVKERDNLYVLNHVESPAVLSEVAFISNQKEEQRLMKDEFREEAAIALYNGISQYFKFLAGEEF